MNGDNVIIVVEGGVVQSVYSDNVNVQAIVIDLEDKKAGGNFINTFEWSDTHFDDDDVRTLMDQHYERFFGKES